MIYRCIIIILLATVAGLLSKVYSLECSLDYMHRELDRLIKRGKR